MHLYWDFYRRNRCFLIILLLIGRTIGPEVDPGRISLWGPGLMCTSWMIGVSLGVIIINLIIRKIHSGIMGSKG